jgi:X-X-X-Leu-X-X-Gly heptad repeat protein
VGVRDGAGVRDGVGAGEVWTGDGVSVGVSDGSGELDVGSGELGSGSGVRDDGLGALTGLAA